MPILKKEITVNGTTERYLTFGQLTPVALKGLIGAIMGYNGLAKAFRENTTIEFLDKLKDIQFASIPQNKKGYFDKQIVKSTNTTGFANKGGATNLLEHEYIENPDVITDSFDDFEQLCNTMLRNKTKYPLTFGQNGLQASYSEVEVIDNILEIEEKEGLVLDNLVPLKDYNVTFIDSEFDFESDDLKDHRIYLENLPVDYDNKRKYVYELFKQTSEKIENTILPVINISGQYIAIHK